MIDTSRSHDEASIFRKPACLFKWFTEIEGPSRIESEQMTTELTKAAQIH